MGMSPKCCNQNDPKSFFEATKGVVFFEACLFMILGFFAIAVPFLFGLAVDLAIGLVLIAGGCTQLYRTIKSWSVSGGFGSLLLSLITTAAGVLLLFRPLAGMLALTTLVAIYFFLEACAKMYWAMTSAVAKAGWLFFSGILSLILSVIIASGLPGTAVWALGVLVGVDCICFSVFLFMLSSSLNCDDNE